MRFSCFDNSNFDYNALVNKPCVNGCILSGDVSFEDMGIACLVECYTLQYAQECIYPTVDCCLSTKQDNLTAGCGICLDCCSNISVNPDSTLCATSENAIKNCTVSCAVCDILRIKQDVLCAGRAIDITGNCISVVVDDTMDCTSTHPVSNCAVNQAIECIMACGYQEGNGITMTTDSCGCHVISLADCVDVVCNFTVGGCSELCGPLTIWGDIFQCGSAYCTHAEELYTCCDCIFLRDRASTPLASADGAGIVVLNYNGSANAILHIDNTGTWRLGETDGDPNQVIATRAETCDTENNALAVWNCTCQCFDTTYSADNQVLTWDNACIISLQNSLNVNHTKLKGEITNADTVTMHDYDSFAHLEADIQKQDREFSRYDNVAGVACNFCMTNIFAYSQCGCCVDYSVLCEGPISCAVCCKAITIPYDGSVPSVTACTDCPDASSLYAYCFEDECSAPILSLYSQEDELYDELECYTVTNCDRTVLCRTCYSYIPNKTGSAVDGCYAASDYTNDPMYCHICAVQLCYTLDSLGVYCADCTYYTYDSGSMGYICTAVIADSYVPATYFFQSEDSHSESDAFDLVYGNGCSVTYACNFINNTVQSVDSFNVYRGLSLGTVTCDVCYNPTCTCATYTCCYPIEKLNICVYEKNNRINICESGNGKDYLVHSYGLPGNYLEQCRTYHGETAKRTCCYNLNGGCWTDWYSTRQMIFDSAHPVNDKYIQFPGDPEPEELYNKNGIQSTWEDISSHFAGLSMRFAGGLAEEFNKQLTVQSKNGNKVTFTAAHGLTLGSLIVNLETHTQYSISAIDSATVVTLNETPVDLQNNTTVLICQNDTFQGHKHNIDMFTFEQGENGPDGEYFNYRPTKTGDPTDDGVNGTPRTGKETRSKNATVRLWKRVN